MNFGIMIVAGLAIVHGGRQIDNTAMDIGQFATDQRGKLVVYRSADPVRGVDFSAVTEQLSEFAKRNGKEILVKAPGRLEITASVPMERHAGMGNYVAGQINYTLVVEEHEGELNYWFTDLSYQPYRNDRYGKRVKATAAPIPLEARFSKLNQSIWVKQKTYAYQTIDELAGRVHDQLEAIGRSSLVITRME